MSKYLFSCLILFLSFNSFAINVEVAPQKSLIYNKAILLEINQVDPDALVSDSENVINTIIAKIYNNNPRIVRGNQDQLIQNIPASAEARAKKLALIKYPKLDKTTLQNAAKSRFPSYSEGDMIEFTYDPYRKHKVKGKIKRITSDFVFTGFSDSWAIKNIVDPNIRDSFYPAKVKANRDKFVQNSVEAQQLNFTCY